MSIEGFEEYTYDLSTYELKELLPRFIEGFKNKFGPEKVISNAQIVRNLKMEGYQISPVRVRKIISHIRVNHLIELLIATNNGYYIAIDLAEAEVHCKSLKQREDRIRAARHALTKQIRKRSQTELNFNDGE